ncbi:MAG: sigma-70 family RNA polymerase sigma factor, partial [Prevotella sp.]|nr:sigma-70 family RNA polymerase sigma factor [Prevotella sp.]
MSIYNSDPEKILVTRLINGNESAFCKLYALYKNRLICFAMKFVKSRELAEDIFQDTFTAIWQNREFLDPELPFSSYVYTITKNRLLNLLHNIERDQKLKNHLLSGAIDFSNETENSILSTDLSQLLDRALQLLTPQQRRVFEMSRTEMKSH